MNWSESLRLALVNLRQTPLRTALTAAGVMIGTGTLVCIFAFSVGLQRLTTGELLKYRALTTIQVMPAGDSRQPPGHARGQRTATRPRLDDAALARFRRIPGVSSATPVIQFPLEIRCGEQRRTSLGRSHGENASTGDKAFPIWRGRYAHPHTAGEVAVSKQCAADLGFTDPADLLGREIELSFFAAAAGGGAGGGPVPFPAFSVARRLQTVRVVGIVEPPAGAFDNPFLRVDVLLPVERVKALGLMDVAALQSLLRNPTAGDPYQTVEVRIVAATDAVRVEQAIEKMGYRTLSLISVLGEMNRFFILMDAGLGALGGVSLLVACLGIVNTMIIAVLERRRDIGIMKAVGSRRADIRRLFFLEGGVIGFAGGVLGVGLGWVTSLGINFGMNIYIEQQGTRPAQLFHFPAWLIAAAVAFATLVALVSALYPAIRAARLDPVASLRHE
jgi:putative ABC transport system permease protein